MRRVVVLALLALALPMAAWANGIDIVNQFGSISVSASGISSVQSQLKTFNGITASSGALGSVSFSTGACLTNCGNLAAGNSTFSASGSSFVVTCVTAACGGHMTLFSGAFVGPITWTLDAASSGKKLIYDLTGTIAGMLYTGQFVTGTTTQKFFTVGPQLANGIAHIGGGTTNLAVPEPGTLGLLGTGLLGIAGMFRRKILGS